MSNSQFVNFDRDTKRFLAAAMACHAITTASLGVVNDAEAQRAGHLSFGHMVSKSAVEIADALLSALEEKQ